MKLPEPGTVIGGLRIDGVAGKGAMGVVYRAHHLALDRTVAMKIVNPDLANDDVFRERFRREARLAAVLDHPHIVPIYHAGDDQGHLYLTMRYIDGVDLSTMIARHGPLPPADAIEIVAQIGDALDAAQARGLVHRDVKPANILITRPRDRWYAYLTDFGISKDVRDGALTQTGTAIGTLDYIAPEQLEGGALDHRADQYALGCVLFKTLTGRVPFPRETDAARMYAHVSAPVPPLDSVRPGVGGPLDGVVARAMAKRPVDRYGSAGEFTRAARQAIASPLSTGSAAIPTPATPTGGTKRRAWVIGGVAATVLALGGVAALTLPDRSPAAGPTTSTTAGGPPAGRIVGAPIKVGTGPVDLTDGDGYLWTANGDAASISRIDPRSRAATDFSVAGQPTEMVVGQGKAWVWNYSSAITPVDVRTGTSGALIRLAADIGQIAAGDKAVWFSAPSKGAIGKIDMVTGQFDGRYIHVGQRPVAISVANGKVYVVNQSDRTLVTVEEKTGQVIGSPRTLPSGVTQVSAVGDRLYVLGSVGMALAGPANISSSQLVPLRGATGLTIGSSFWLSYADRDEVQRIAPDLRTPIGGPVKGFGRSVSDMEVIDGSLWVADRDASTLVRVEIASP
ncbi:serine/threonine-protein kinase [Luteipulveratus mongoliensis]|uniref:serine/threonine-protein kinase n=1 Tax=Luteipulveratus mongoliensis TaxID=571913 RepID=UPI0006967AAB|nr:serine/threonine-protein kinase [Luteipulveratus mongoliensis]